MLAPTRLFGVLALEPTTHTLASTLHVRTGETKQRDDVLAPRVGTSWSRRATSDLPLPAEQARHDRLLLSFLSCRATDPWDTTRHTWDRRWRQFKDSLTRLGFRVGDGNLIHG